MIYNYNGVDNGLRIRAYYDNGWHAEIESNEDRYVQIVTLPDDVKTKKDVKLWAKQYVHQHAEGQYCQLSWIYNPNGKDNGLIISIFVQSTLHGNHWVAQVTDDNTRFWREIPLQYGIETFDDVIEWAIDYADGERLIFSA